jgi:hypothetical protein
MNKTLVVFLLLIAMVRLKREPLATPVTAHLKTQSGWRIGKLPHVKDFVEKFAHMYPNLTIEETGTHPVMSFYDNDG